MTRSVSAPRVATLLGSATDRSPAYRAIADGLRLLVADGRVLPGTRLPSERDLTGALGVSRTTVARAYELLREQGYLVSRRGSGSVTRLPETRGAVEDHVLRPGDGRPDTLDLTTAASAAPPGVAAAYERAVAELPAVPQRQRLLPLRPAGAARAAGAAVRRPRPAHHPGPGRRHRRGAGRPRRGHPGLRRHRGPGARGEPDLPERDRRAAPLGHPRARHPGRAGRLGRRGADHLAAPGRAAAGVPGARLPQPDRLADGRPDPGGGRRRPGPQPHARAGRRVARRPVPDARRRDRDAAAAGRARRRHGHDRVRRQGLLGRSADRLAARPGRPHRRAGLGPADAGPGLGAARAAGARRPAAAARRGPRPPAGPAARAPRPPGRRAVGGAARAGASGFPRAGSRCGASSRPRSRPRSPSPPSSEACCWRPAAASHRRAGSSGSSGCRTPVPPSS